MKRLLLLPLAVATALATGNFYEETVPPLPAFLKYDRLPKKTVDDITSETDKEPEAAQVDFAKALDEITEALKGGKAPRELLPKVDALLVAEREQDAGLGGNALLHDLRDLCAGAADAAAAADYFVWRRKQYDALGMTPPPGVIPDPQRTEPLKVDDDWLKAVQARLEAAPPAIKPHYLYARAAHRFLFGDQGACRGDFEKVVADFPNHPRAEVASYMVGRCFYWDSRTEKDGAYVNVEPAATNARTAFEGYLKKFPQGSYAGDAHGWLGGLDNFADHPETALGHFIQQLETPGHPEYLGTAPHEIEVCLRALHEKPAAIAAALTTPRVAQAVVYFAGNEIEPVEGDGQYDPPDFVAQWRRALFTEIAAALAKKPELFRAPGWEPRYFVTLALAQSGAGNQAEALKILDSAPGEADEDRAFARAVVLQRAKRSDEAAAAFAALDKSFPDSDYLPAARIREALSLVDAHRSGEAAIVLLALEEPKKPDPAAPKPDLPEEAKPGDAPAGEVKDDADEEDGDDDTDESSAHRVLADVGPSSPAQARQLLDTIFNFAPLPELAKTEGDAKVPEVSRLRLRGVIAARHLARERFAEAHAFMTDAEWKRTAAPLAALTTAALAAKTPAEKAATAMKLADAWAAARGKLLTVPLDTEEWRRAVFKDDHGLANFRRMENGQALGLAGATVLDLENRDELRHAFNWWITASDALPRTPQAATAIWRALRAMPGIAEVSPFVLDRVTSKKWEEVSHKLYERLQQEHPAAPETKRFAVWWNFGTGRADDGKPERREAYDDRLPAADPGDEPTPFEGVLARVQDVLPGKHGDLAKLRGVATSGRRWAQENLHALESQCVVNYFEDLDQFLATPDLTMAAANRYVELRYATLDSAAIGYGSFPPLEKDAEKPGTVRGDDALLAEIRKEMAEPRFAKAVDFLAFLEIAVTANHWVSLEIGTGKELPDKDGEKPTYWGRDYVALEKMCRAWLEKYPKSPKREAVLLLHCRALRHAMEPYVYYRNVSWPEARRWEGADVAEYTERMKFDAKMWKAALDRYDKEFPKGRYAADVLSCRADLAVKLKDWKRALQISLDQKKHNAHLGPDAQNRLNEIFARLAVDEDRADLLTAIRATPGAREELLAALKVIFEGPDHPLDKLNDWLVDQVRQ